LGSGKDTELNLAFTWVDSVDGNVCMGHEVGLELASCNYNAAVASLHLGIKKGGFLLSDESSYKKK